MVNFIAICTFTCVLSQTLAKKPPYWEYTRVLSNWSRIVPDVLDKLPNDVEFLQVLYPSGAEVLLGNYLNRTQAYDPPLMISWKADPSAYYVLILEDPDSPLRENYMTKKIIRWMVGNIPGNDVSAGETIFAHTAPPDSYCREINRYVFLVYKQAGKTNYTREMNGTEADQGALRVKTMQPKYRWEGPVALNFFCYRCM